MKNDDQVPANFLGLRREVSDYAAARVVVLPIGFESTTSYGTGTRNGPDAILLASRQIERFDPDLQMDLADAPIHTADPVAPEEARLLQIIVVLAFAWLGVVGAHGRSVWFRQNRGGRARKSRLSGFGGTASPLGMRLM